LLGYDGGSVRGQGTFRIYLAVVGPGDDATPAEIYIAWQVGLLLADRMVIVVCGGSGGVMAAVCDGAASAGGLTVGLLPGRDRAAGNEHLSVALPTGLGEQRNGLVVAAGDARTLAASTQRADKR
jgi:uncharacterized protein (TIGR00725 family)